jgi:CO/xanthine dehydrogenase Mo-binding subunit
VTGIDDRVGGSPNRVGGIPRVTGAQAYVADIRPPDLLESKLVTLDCARARIISIDATEALRVPGCRAVLTADDLPQPVPRFGPQFPDRPVIAVGETKYHGDPVALVVADTRDAAEEAAGLVRVEHEALPAVYTVAGALADDAPLVREPELRPNDPLAATNVLREHRVGWGDVDAATAEVVVEHRYSFPMVTQFAIEPHAFMAAPDDDGIRVWSSIQHPNWLQKVLAGVLCLPLSRVRVIAPDPGGGFGGKQHAKFEPLVAFAALRTGRPVRLVLTLEETFQAVRRAACEIHVRTGFRSDGRLAFQDIEADYLIGAYADIADRVVGKGSYPACGPYNVPAARIRARSILSHTTPSTAFRGFGYPQVNWAVESNLDEGARALGIDRLELRLRNLAAKGDAFIPFDTPADGEWDQSLRKAAELIGWGTPLPPGHGRGIAVGIKSGPTTGLSYATVRLLADGSVVVFAGTSDMGQGARTVLAQIAAQELGAPLDWVTVVMGDTAVVPYDQQTSASRSTVLMGNAVLNACREIQARLRAMAGRLHGLDEAEITVDAGVVRLPDRELSVLEVLTPGLGRLGGELIGNGEARKEAEPGHPLGGAPAFFEFNCTAIEARVDEATGDVTLVRHVTVSDVGRSINPLQVRMQDEGAAIMGLGHTLMEHYIYDDAGRIRNLGAIDYRIPTSMDLPLEMVSETVENADGPGPYGAKGMSEGALLCTAPAVAAAVREACGAVIRDLPLTPERVWRAIQERDGAAAEGRQAAAAEGRQAAATGSRQEPAAAGQEA